MSDYSFDPSIGNLSISISANRNGDAPDRNGAANEPLRMMKENPLQFLWSTFRLITPFEVHCGFADSFRNWFLEGELPKLFRHYEDQQSIDAIELGMERLLSHPSVKLSKSFFHDPVAMMTQQEWDDHNDFMKKLPVLENEYHHAFDDWNATNFYYHHGLREMTDKPGVLARISEGTAFDLGSFDGGSIAVMAKYGPNKIIGFEPSHKNIVQCRENLQKAQIGCEYDVVESCIGNQDGHVSLHDSGDSTAAISNTAKDGNVQRVPICKMDTFCERNGIGKVSWIKADLEGAALDMVKGAERTIRRDHPLLTLGIYHSPQEFFEIPELLHQWIPEYKMRMRRCQCAPTVPYNELTLIAYID